MNIQPQLKMQDFPAIALNSFVTVDGEAPEQLVWKADGAAFTAATPSGSWKLALAEKNGRIDAAVTGTLKKKADVLDFTLFQLPAFHADHVLPQNIKMGGCQAHNLKNMTEPAAFSGQIMTSVTKDGVTMQISTPFHAGFPVLAQGIAEQGQIRDFRLVMQAHYYGGAELVFPVVSFRTSRNGFELMDAYADENCDVKKEFAAPSAGWNSWDYYRWTITENEVLKNAEFIAKDPVLSKHVKRIIVDDGWQYCYGEWDANSWFPSGMEHLAKELTKMGFEPGLWFAPAIAEPHSRIAQLDYDMLAGSVGGQPCLAYECMRRVGFILDPTVRKTEKFLEDTFRRYADMGYKYFKLDFLCSMFNAPRFSDPNIKRDELIPRLLAPVWRGINGRSVLLGCNYPYTAGNSMVEAVRIGADIHARWDNLTHNLPAVASHFWANKKLWLNDPDFALCRSAETSNDPDLNRLNPMWPFVTPDQTYNPERNFEQATMNRSELEILLSLVLAAAGAVNLSDKMPLLNEQGLFLARKVVSAESGEAARPLDLFSAARPARFLQKLKSGWRVLLVNWGETAEQVSFDLAAHGVRAASATDFWAEKPVSISSGRLEFELAPHSCKLIELN